MLRCANFTFFLSRSFAALVMLLVLVMAPRFCLGGSSAAYMARDARLTLARDKYCGAYVVWHTLRYYGKAKPIDAVVDQLRLDEKEGASIADVVALLNSLGIEAESVRIQVDHAGSLMRPHIPYLPPVGGRKQGHFVFCVPTADGAALVADGRRPPYLIEMKNLEREENRAGWDGSTIVLGTACYGDWDGSFACAVLMAALGGVGVGWLFSRCSTLFNLAKSSG